VGESDHEKMRQRKSDFFLPFQNNNNNNNKKAHSRFTQLNKWKNETNKQMNK